MNNIMFKRRDLKNGMVVEFNTGEKRMVWEENLIDKRGYIPLGYIDGELYNSDSLIREYIIAIYLTHDVGYFEDFFNESSLTCIWKRF